MVKAIHSWKPISKRPTGRPKIRWEGDVKKDIQRLKVPNWKTFVQDTRRWKEVAEKAKTLHQELYSPIKKKYIRQHNKYLLEYIGYIFGPVNRSSSGHR